MENPETLTIKIRSRLTTKWIDNQLVSWSMKTGNAWSKGPDYPIWTDGFMDSIEVASIGMLKGCIQNLVERYNINYQIRQMELLPNYSLTEHQFAGLVGKCRMYGHLPQQIRSSIPQLQLVDTQIATVCRDYYKDNSFCRDKNGDINLWKLYNLFTGANKSSYIDNFLDRGVNAYQFIESVRFGLENKQSNWFLD